ncbi:MAG: hypothetical protein CM15mP49_27800 [Actinomycetota bacterium]|nr:MAG: hypothetical protein CM15mP49_27800 [Actinomycetota bacterium]
MATGVSGNHPRAHGKSFRRSNKNSEQKLDEVKRSKDELDQWQRKLDTEEQNMDLAQERKQKPPVTFKK